MADTLHDALHDECEKLAQYKRDGFEALPLAAVTRALSRVADAARPFTDWLSEGEAKLRSNKSEAWLRAQFPAWESQGLARWNPAKPRVRQFLRCVVPQRPNVDAARDAGRSAVGNA